MLKSLLAKAETAQEQYQWAEAQQYYKMILEQEPNYLDAQAGLQHVRRMQALEATIKDLIAHGDTAAQAGDYEAAWRQYTDALNQAGQARLLKYHPQLQQKRGKIRDLLTQKKDIDLVLRQVEKHVQAGRQEKALSYVSQTLARIPDEPLYQPLISQLEKTQAALKQDLDAEARFHQANQAFQAQNFEEASLLYQSIPPDSVRYEDAQNYLHRAKTLLGHIEATLEAAEELFQNGHLEGALAELDHLRRQHPKNPDWQQRWLRIGLITGETNLHQGRNAVIERDFRGAQRHFLNAREAFLKVLSVAAQHPQAKEGLQAATDSYEIAVDAGQAVADYQTGRKAESLQALKRALSRLEEARANQRDYPTLTAVLNALYQSYYAEHQRTDLETRLLRLERLAGSPEPDLAELLDQVSQIQPEVGAYPHLVTRLETIHQRLTDRQSWQVEQTQDYERAKLAWREGNLNEAIQILNAIIQSSDDDINSIPAVWSERLQIWQDLRADLISSQTTLEDLWHQVQADYQTLAQHLEDMTETVSRLSEIQGRVTQATQIIEAVREKLAQTLSFSGDDRPDDNPDGAENQPNRIEFSFPGEWDLFREKIALISQSVENMGVDTPLKGLSGLEAAHRRWPDDQIIQALLERIKVELQANRETIRRQIDQAVQADNLNQALASLEVFLTILKANTSGTSDRSEKSEQAAFTTLYENLKKRHALEIKLNKLWEQTKIVPGSDGIDQALDACEAGLIQLISAPLDWVESLIEDAQRLLQAILTLPVESPIENQEIWSKGQTWLQEYRQITLPHWLTRWGVNFAEAWLRLNRNKILGQTIHTARAQENFNKAYQAALIYLNDYPNDALALEQEKTLREKLINQTLEIATDRLADVDAALEAGAFQTALDILSALEIDYYTPLVTYLPQGLPQDPRLSQQKTRIGALEDQAKTRLALQKASVEANTGYHLARTPDELEIILDALKKLTQNLNWSSVPEAEQAKYYADLERVQTKHEKLRSLNRWENAADQAIETENFRAAAEALENALDVVLDDDKRASLQIRLGAVKDRVEKQRQREELMQTGLDYFSQGQYQEALAKLHQAQALGAPVANLLLAAELGSHLAEAHQTWSQKEWAETEDALAYFFDLAEQYDQDYKVTTENPHAMSIIHLAHSLQNRLERKLARFKQAQESQKIWQTELQAAQRELASGNLASVEVHLQKILVQDPDQIEAKKLQTRLELAYKVKMMHRQIEGLLNEGNYEGAMAIIETILTNIIPDDTDTLALRDRVERGLEANKALLEAQYSARGNQFQRAKTALERAIALGADPNRLSAVQNEVADLEHQKALDIILPIKELIRDGRYEEAFRRSQIALTRHNLPDFQGDLENLQADLISHWAERSLETAQAFLKTEATQPEAKYDQLIAMLKLVCHLDPPPPTHLAHELQTLYQDIQKKRLGLYLETAQDQAQAQSWTLALNSIRTVQKEAEAFDFSTLLYQATRLEMDFIKAQEEAEVQKRRQTFDNILAETESYLAQAVDRAGLIQALAMAQEAETYSDLDQENRIPDLIEMINQAIDQYEATQTVLRQSQAALLRRDLRRASLLLEGKNFALSPLLKTELEQLKSIIAAVNQAETAHDQQNWAEAFMYYRRGLETAQALRIDHDLAEVLDAEIAHCRRHLTETTLNQIRSALADDPPDLEKAQQYFEKAETERWFMSTTHDEVARLKAELVGWTALEEAMHCLRAETPDPQAALVALEAAEANLPPVVLEGPWQAWQTLAQAMSSWQEGDLEAAEKTLDRLEDNYIDIDLAKRLRQSIEETKAFHEMLQTAYPQLESLLSQPNPDYVQAVALVQGLTGHPGWDSQGDQLNQALLTRLETALAEARQTNAYSDAFEIAVALKQFNDAITLETMLKTEQTQKLRQALNQAQQALEIDDLTTAHHALDQASTIAGADRSDIKQLRERLTQRETSLGQTLALLDEVQAAMQEMAWTEAVDKLLEGRTMDTEPALLDDAFKKLKAQFHTLAQTELKLGHYNQAIALCSLGLRLGENRALNTLLSQIERERAEHYHFLESEIDAALSRWDTTKAKNLLEEIRIIQSDKDKLRKLTARLDTLEKLAFELNPLMQEAWAALRERNYAAVQNALRQANYIAPSFYEAQRWRDYASGLYRAVQMVQGNQTNQPALFAQAQAHLTAAEKSLRFEQVGDVPVLIPDLPDWRRQALWESQCLLTLLQEIIELSQALETKQAESPPEARTAVLTQLKMRLSEFHACHQNPPPMSEGFRPAGAGSNLISSSIPQGESPEDPSQKPSSDKPTSDNQAALPEENTQNTGDAAPDKADESPFVWDSGEFILPTYNDDTPDD